MINSIEFKNIIKDKNILKEQDIAFNQVIKRLDLLCIGDDEIVVMDYKSSKKFITQNEDQVREYMSILSQIYPQKRVVGKIIYLLNDKVEFLNVDLI
ncbi:Dna2/Cas4 domain-containing protein [Campylobacter fetus subsp. fetus]|nr:Dna2/Cas4 domain-containing protein [Campylobacter fetus subsp. fetus]